MADQLGRRRSAAGVARHALLPEHPGHPGAVPEALHDPPDHVVGRPGGPEQLLVPQGGALEVGMFLWVCRYALFQNSGAFGSRPYPPWSVGVLACVRPPCASGSLIVFAGVPSGDKRVWCGGRARQVVVAALSTRRRGCARALAVNPPVSAGERASRPFERLHARSSLAVTAADGAQLPAGVDRVVLPERAVGLGGLLAHEQPVNHGYVDSDQGICECAQGHGVMDTSIHLLSTFPHPPWSLRCRRTGPVIRPSLFCLSPDSAWVFHPLVSCSDERRCGSVDSRTVPMPASCTGMWLHLMLASVELGWKDLLNKQLRFRSPSPPWTPWLAPVQGEPSQDRYPGGHPRWTGGGVRSPDRCGGAGGCQDQRLAGSSKQALRVILLAAGQSAGIGALGPLPSGAISRLARLWLRGSGFCWAGCTAGVCGGPIRLGRFCGSCWRCAPNTHGGALGSDGENARWVSKGTSKKAVWGKDGRRAKHTSVWCRDGTGYPCPPVSPPRPQLGGTW